MSTDLPPIGWANLVAPLWFVTCWIGYAVYADGGRRTLMLRMHEYRQVWMRQMLMRENRIVDTQILSVLIRNISFFTSTAILVIGGLLAVLGARDGALAALADIPLTTQAPPLLVDVKILLLVVIFVYSFFTFTWSLRQFNYVVIMVGAAPPRENASTAGALRLAERAAEVATRAADLFNKGMRAYYFGLGALSWLLSPYLFVAATGWVVFVIWRREFRSETLSILGGVGEPIA